MADINVTYATLDDGDDFRDGEDFDGLFPNLCLFMKYYFVQASPLAVTILKVETTLLVRTNL